MRRTTIILYPGFSVPLTHSPSPIREREREKKEERKKKRERKIHLPSFYVLERNIPSNFMMQLTISISFSLSHFFSSHFFLLLSSISHNSEEQRGRDRGRKNLFHHILIQFHSMRIECKKKKCVSWKRRKKRREEKEMRRQKESLSFSFSLYFLCG